MNGILYKSEKNMLDILIPHALGRQFLVQGHTQTTQTVIEIIPKNNAARLSRSIILHATKPDKMCSPRVQPEVVGERLQSLKHFLH